MPYKRKSEQRAYLKGYHAGYRKATIDHLGGECVVCGSTENLQVHHPNRLRKQSRQLSDYEDLSECELRCKKHHPDKMHYDGPT